MLELPSKKRRQERKHASKSDGAGVVRTTIKTKNYHPRRGGRKRGENSPQVRRTKRVLQVPDQW